MSTEEDIRRFITLARTSENSPGVLEISLDGIEQYVERLVIERNVIERERNRKRVDYAFRLIACANTVICSSLEEMEQVVLRALSGEFDGDIGGLR